VNLHDLVALEAHGPDTYVGIGHPYPWGGLYGGHIVAQALAAAAETVDDTYMAHSLRAYFIERGDNSQTVRYEVDRIRNGRSFATRRVVSRQARGAILNLECSFQVPETTEALDAVSLPTDLIAPEELPSDTWSDVFDRRWVRGDHVPTSRRGVTGWVGAWMRAKTDGSASQFEHQCALAYISDDLPTDAVFESLPAARAAGEKGQRFSASLDHTIWFHRPHRSDQWHFYEMSCTAFVGGRGLTSGHVYAADGSHIATIAQETLVRWRTAST
jgi:acyl-CoA thioesterase II